MHTISRWRGRPRLTSAIALLLVSVSVACRADAPTAPPLAEAPIAISAALAGTDVRVLSVIVTGPGIATPLVANAEIAAEQSSVSLTMQVPVGGQRTFVARGYDADGVVTHEGMATTVVRPSGNPPVPIRMYARTGEVPIDVGFGAYTVTLTPGGLADAMVGESRQLSAAVTNAQGIPVPGAVVMWGSLDPGVARIGATGFVSPRRPGTTTLFASYEGAVASVDLTVLPLQFREISAGFAFTCALDQRGGAWCWGHNDNGQLGVAASVPSSARPMRVATNAFFHSVSAGTHHACAVTLGDEVRCWGYNVDGQVGGDPSPMVRAPRTVTGLGPARAVIAGHRSTCSIALVGGEAWCWGYGDPGSLGLTGDGPAENVTSPALVTDVSGPWASLSVTSWRSCGVTLTGAISCNGSQGMGFYTGFAEGIAWRSLVPNSPAFALDLVVCGVTAASEIRCWGRNDFGQLGTGTIGLDAGVPSVVQGLQGYEAVGLVSEYACGLRAGVVLCWGKGAGGQLGTGDLENRAAPTPVASDRHFTRLAVAGFHACALSGDGEAWCWGSGFGSTPVRVPSPLPITQ
jgi:alpha-tubulin suppressor-like RCC1 family protein